MPRPVASLKPRSGRSKVVTSISIDPLVFQRFALRVQAYERSAVIQRLIELYLDGEVELKPRLVGTGTRT